MNALTYRLAKVASKPLPRGLFYSLAHRWARREYQQFVRARLGPYYCEVTAGPPAPPEVMLTTRAMDQRELSEHLRTDRFFAGSYKTVHAWLKVLERHGMNVRTIGSVLEIGCGSARLLRHFRAFGGTQVVGCDADLQAIEWCRQNIPGAEFHHNQLSPPLTFAADDSFDVILAASVFTHVPLDVQRAWLLELRRVLRPGGIFLCTVEGWFNHRRQLTEADRQTLRREGHVTLDRTSPNASLSTQALGSWDVFQTRAQVVQSYGSVFQMLDYVPDMQDLLVLQKPLWAAAAGDGPAPRLYADRVAKEPNRQGTRYELPPAHYPLEGVAAPAGDEVR